MDSKEFFSSRSSYYNYDEELIPGDFLSVVLKRACGVKCKISQHEHMSNPLPQQYSGDLEGIKFTNHFRAAYGWSSYE